MIKDVTMDQTVPSHSRLNFTDLIREFYSKKFVKYPGQQQIKMFTM